MDKSSLIKIISGNIKEMDILISSFDTSETVSPAYFRLARKKIETLSEELDLLEELNIEKSAIKSQLSKTEIQPPAEEPIQEKVFEEPIKIEELEKPIKPTEKIVEEIKVETPKQEVVQPTKQELDDVLEIEETPAFIIEQKKEVIVVEEKPKPIEKPTEVKKTSTEQKHPTTLAEKLGQNKVFVHETLSHTKDSNITEKLLSPITDLKTSFNLNDRFLFQRELFENNSEVMMQTLEQLNSFSNIDEAQVFLSSNFDWVDKHKVAVQFMNHIKRKYYC